jgi:hypothetical protein
VFPAVAVSGAQLFSSATHCWQLEDVKRELSAAQAMAANAKADADAARAEAAAAKRTARNLSAELKEVKSAHAALAAEHASCAPVCFF